METRSGKCVFCGEPATKLNKEEQPVCRRHKEREPKDIGCKQCGMPLKIRSSRKGFFWGCEGYPQCQNTFSIGEKLDEGIE